MNKLSFLALLTLFVIIIASCAAENEYMANIPKIYGFKVKKIFILNKNMLATYTDSFGNSIVFKFDESSASWKRILFKTKVSLNY